MSSPTLRNLREKRAGIPLASPALVSIEFRLRRARDATRTKLSRETVRGSGWSLGGVDESAPGSANSWSDSFLEHTGQRANLCVRTEKTAICVISFVRSPCECPLTATPRSPRVPIAPSTERLRLMALRSAVASADVSREVGRGSHRLGAFLRAISTSNDRVPRVSFAFPGESAIDAICGELRHPKGVDVRKSSG